MKKLVILSAAIMALAACNGNKQGSVQNAQSGADSTKADSVVYEGVTPSADGFGIKYRVAFANDGSKGFGMDEAYMKDSLTADSVAHYTGTAADTTVNGKSFCVLKTSGNDTYRFEKVDESTIRLVGSDFKEAASGLPYDLKLQK